ncbi:MAG TPA: DJ-1/PfpI family protein [Candidatus Polarisedimenticolia bacterium]|nr:DJ-1/PfpI family protein [Candidatus Polarisedimenticolia bacterium]
MMPAIHVLVFDGLADWEPGHALTGLRRWGGLQVVSVGFDRNPVVTMGGLRLVPDATLEAVRPEAVRLLLLPGGELWESPALSEAPIAALLRSCEGRGVPIAAICGATIPVARAGLLRRRRHTSNGPDYLPKWAPGLTRPQDYLDAPAARDRGVITAGGLTPVDFALEIFRELELFSEADRDLWYRMYRHGRSDAGPPPGAGA